MIYTWDRFGTVANRWIAERLGAGSHRGFDKCVALLAVDNGDIEGAVAFHDYWPEKGLIEVTIVASPHCFARGAMRAAMAYGFSVARMLVAHTAESNLGARKLWGALGGSEYLVPEMWGAGEACAVLTLTAKQWKESRCSR